MRPTAIGIRVMAAGFAVALLPALGLPQAWPMTPILWGTLLLAYGLDALLSPKRGAVSWSLDAPGVLYIGRAEPVGLTVTVPSSRPLHGSASIDLSEDLRPQPDAAAPVGGGADARFEWSLVPRRRGTVEIEGAWIRYKSPFGLWEWAVDAELAEEIPVLPDLPLVRSTALRFFGDPTFRAGLKIERYKGDGTEFESLKEFAVGDDHRSIDWKASARHRKLLDRQFRAERNHQVVLAVDTGHLMSEEVEGVPKLDHALGAALLLAYVGLSSGDRIGLFTFGSRVGPGLLPVSGVSSISALTRVTSEIEYSHDETNFTLGLTTLAQRLRRRSLVILLTDFVDTVTAELMVENVHRIGRRHLIVFVSIRDPLLMKESRRSPVDVEALHRCVVAHNLLRDRELVHRRLKSAGVHPLDVEPDRVSPELINRYLDIKRRELI